MDLNEVQSSQLFINEKKLVKVQKTINLKTMNTVDQIPIKRLDGDIIFTDGHTRALTLHKLGQRKILVEWETADLSWLEYRECVKWCKDVRIYQISDLENRIVSDEEYKIKWLQRCQDNREVLGIDK